MAFSSLRPSAADKPGPVVGLLGGTFDPPHIGHLVAADQVRVQLQLDEVWLVVANDPWQKQGSRTITPARTRLALTEAAVGSTPGLAVSDVELEREGPTYSIDTLDVVEQRHPGVTFVLIVGADAAAGLDTWHRAEELAARVSLAVVDRPGTPIAVPDGWRFQVVDIPDLAVSSTDLRERFATGRSVRFLTPDAVIDQCRAEGLYAR